MPPRPADAARGRRDLAVVGRRHQPAIFRTEGFTEADYLSLNGNYLVELAASHLLAGFAVDVRKLFDDAEAEV
jgi:hypothetical protein